MPVILNERDREVREIMDDPACDLEKLYQTYRYFKPVNRVLSGWRTVYVQKIRPRLKENKPSTLLDIGFGGGDIPIYLASWAKKDGLQLEIDAIDRDERALRFVETYREPPANVTFRFAHTQELVSSGKSYDFVTSNHLLHHLNRQKIKQLCSDAMKLCHGTILFNDIARSDWAYALYYIGSRLVPRNSFIHIDGLISIRRSYTRGELEEILPSDWRVEKPFPFRLLATWTGQGEDE